MNHLYPSYSYTENEKKNIRNNRRHLTTNSDRNWNESNQGNKNSYPDSTQFVYKTDMLSWHKIDVRVRMLRCYYFSVLYGLVAWALKQIPLYKLATSELWCYRRVHRISWTKRESFKCRSSKKWEMNRKAYSPSKNVREYLGHVMTGQK